MASLERPAHIRVDVKRSEERLGWAFLATCPFQPTKFCSRKLLNLTQVSLATPSIAPERIQFSNPALENVTEQGLPIHSIYVTTQLVVNSECRSCLSHLKPFLDNLFLCSQNILFYVLKSVFQIMCMFFQEYRVSNLGATFCPPQRGWRISSKTMVLQLWLWGSMGSSRRRRMRDRGAAPLSNLIGTYMQYNSRVTQLEEVSIVAAMALLSSCCLGMSSKPISSVVLLQLRFWRFSPFNTCFK